MKIRSLVGWGLRPGVGIAGMGLAFWLALPDRGVPVGEALGAAWKTGAAETALWWGVAAAIFAAGYAVGAWRFWLLLRGGGLTPRYPTLLRAYVVAGFFNMVLPGAILGDAYRVWDVRDDLGRGSEALGLVALERLLSLGALGSIGLLALPAIPLASDRGQLGAALVGLGACFLVATAAVLIPATNRWLRRIAALLGRFSPRFANAAEGALEAVASVARRPRLLTVAFALSLVTQALPVLAAVALARPLDAVVGLHWYAIIVPFVTLIALVPITIGGAGVRESLYVALFGAVGMRPEAALALSLSAFAVSMAWAAVGGLIFLWSRRQPAGLPAEVGGV